MGPMSDSQDDQAGAEALDEDTLGADQVDDIDEDVVRESFPPDHQQGIEGLDVEEEPERPPPVDLPVTGLIRPEDDPDEEVAELGDVDRFPPAEEAAVHETAPPPDHERDSYLEE
jgi:hypothetical protein